MTEWVKFFDDDLRYVSTERAHEIARECVKSTVAVFKNQNLTPNDETTFCGKIGNWPKAKDADPAQLERAKNIILPEGDGILRVTGKKNENGKPGLFGHVDDLDWHANQPSNPNRMPLIWLYGAEGTKGSRTSWINMIDAYNDLDQDTKDLIKDINVYCGYKQGNYSNSEYFNDHVNKNLPQSLVKTNAAGETGLFFPFLQIFEFEGHINSRFDEIMDMLKQHVLNEKYVYHHDWEDGDVVISEQWLSIHKRWKFEHMDTRILHRISFDYAHVNFEKVDNQG